jgi:hypothetical protein
MLVDVIDPALSDEARPQAPDVDAVPVSSLGRRVGEHLVEVHDMYRRELDQLRDVLEQVRSGQLSAGGARGELQRIALLANNWTFGGICQQYCLQLTQHHDVESGQIFPHLRRAEPALVPVLDQLHREHEVIHDVIRSVDAALIGLASTPNDLTNIELAVDTLAETLLSHFAYEERSLVGPLARHGFYPGQL